MKYSSLVPRRSHYFLIGAIFYWFYANKFLTYSVDYVTQMSRDLSFGGVQQNIAYYSNESLILSVGGFLLISYLLIQNEFSNLFQSSNNLNMSVESKYDIFLNMYLWIVLFGLLSIFENGSSSVLSIFTALLKGSSFGLFCGLFVGFLFRGYYSSLFAMLMFVLSYFLVPMLDLSTTGIMFFLVGGSVLTSFLLIQNNIANIFTVDFLSNMSSVRIYIGEYLSIISVIFFAVLVFNISMIPLLSDNLIPILSLILLINVTYWSINLSQENFKPSVQQHRSAAIVFMILLPLLMYLLLRFLFLLNHPDTVMRNRWELAYDFMTQGNTFRVNTWPFEVEPGADSRWLFYKAAIINSARVTLLSIFLCTILGIIVGVTRLSSN